MWAMLSHVQEYNLWLASMKDRDSLLPFTLLTDN